MSWNELSPSFVPPSPFTNEKTIEPNLDLRAETRIAEYTVTVNATGGLNNLEASFTSDPMATQDQIYSLLLTGSVTMPERPPAAICRPARPCPSSAQP